MLLILKLVLAPSLVVLSSLAGRRWGPGLVGLLVALPVVAGPILLITALAQGRRFAADAATASLLGLVTLAGFAVVLAWVSRFTGVVGALAVGWPVCLVADLALSKAAVPPAIGLVTALAATGGAALLMPKVHAREQIEDDRADPAPWPRWDLPARAAATVVLVLVVTGSAARLGPNLTGVLAPFPIATSVVAGFTLALRGHPATVLLLRGVLRGLVGFAVFCFLVAILVRRTGPAVAFATALGAALVLQIAITWTEALRAGAGPWRSGTATRRRPPGPPGRATAPADPVRPG